MSLTLRIPLISGRHRTEEHQHYRLVRRRDLKSGVHILIAEGEADKISPHRAIVLTDEPIVKIGGKQFIRGLIKIGGKRYVQGRVVTEQFDHLGNHTGECPVLIRDEEDANQIVPDDRSIPLEEIIRGASSTLYLLSIDS